MPEGIDGTEAFDHGVAAAYGDYEDWGRQLDKPSKGDTLIAYVNNNGYCATGRVVGPFDSREIQSGSKKIDPRTQVPEWHLPVRWDTVLQLSNAVPRQDGNDILNYKSGYSPSKTIRPIKDSEQGEYLAKVIRGSV